MGEFVSLYTTVVYAKVEGRGRRQEKQQGFETNMAHVLWVMDLLVSVEEVAHEGLSNGREPWQRGCGETFNAHKRVWPGLKSLATLELKSCYESIIFRRQ